MMREPPHKHEQGWASVARGGLSFRSRVLARISITLQSPWILLRDDWRMLVLIKRYWPALVLSALLLILLDSVLSSLLTCHPISAQTGSGGDAQKQQQCTALSGPILLSLIAIVDFLDKHGDAVTGAFTIVLAIFTGRLWFSTEKLWGVTRTAADASLRQANIMMAVESPMPIVIAINLVQYAAIPGENVVVDQVPGGQIPTNCRVMIAYRKQGPKPNKND
jgi:hypothetical protein